MSVVCHTRSQRAGSPHVMLATPSYPGSVSTAYLHAFAGSVDLLRDAGIAFDLLTVNFDCHVDDARNACLREFMRTGCTDLVFLDVDVGWDPGSLIKIIRHDADVVAGVYPKKGDAENWPVFERPGEELRARSDGLVDVIGAPTGFMRIRRAVVERLIEANKHRSFVGQGAAPDSDRYTIVFERTYEDNHRWSGDYSFCRAWRKLGGSIFVDPEMTFVHRGEHEWAGCLGDFWRARAGLDHPELAKAIRLMRGGIVHADIYQTLFDGWGNHFAAQPPLMSALYDLAQETTGPILETGSGITTLVLGLAAERSGAQVHSLEHDLDYYARTKKALDRYGIETVRLHYAPLRKYAGNITWYEIPETLPEEFALVFCDGPQQRFGRGSIFQLMRDRIAGANFVMDDAYSPQVEHLRTWAADGRKIQVFNGAHRAFAVSPAPQAVQIAGG